MTWTIESVGGAAEMDELNFQYANALYKNRAKYRNLEVCQNVKSQTSKTLCLSPPIGPPQTGEEARAVWHHMSKALMAHADFSHPVADRHGLFFLSAFNVWKELKGGPP